MDFKNTSFSIRKNAISLFLLLSIISPHGNAAKWWTQIYGGDTFTENHNAHVNLPDAGIIATHHNLRFDSAPIVGLRESFWIPRFSYLGFGLDVSHFFGPDQKKQTSSTTLCIDGGSCSTSPELIQKFNNNLTAVAFDFALRYPFQIRKYSLQPYVGIGPALFIAKLKDTDNFIPAKQSSTSTSVGLKAYGGLNLFFSKHIGAFVEYQFNSFQAKTNYYNARVVRGVTLGSTLGKETFNIQSVVAGISFQI